MLTEGSSVQDKWLFAALLGLLAWVPVPLGSNRTFAVGILVLWCTALGLGCVWVWRHHADAAWQRLKRFRWPLLLLSFWVLYVWFQTWAIPWGWLEVLSPETWAVEQGVTRVATVSLDVEQTRLYAALSTAYGVCFAVALMTVRDRSRLESLAMAVVWIAVAQAVIGVVLFSVGASYQIFYFDLSHADRLKGTLSYHNFFAGFMELSLSVGIGLMLAKLGESSAPLGAGWKHRVVRWLDFLLSPKMRLRLLLVVMVIALVLTRSRMGNTGFFAALLVVGGLSLLLTRRSAPAMVTLIISLIVVDVVVVGTWVGLEKVVERVQGTKITTAEGGTQESVEARTEAARYALEMLDVFPWVGTGMGSFYNTYIRFRMPSKGFVDHAHNDYAELAADGGAVGIALLGGMVVSTFGVCMLTLARRRSSTPRGISFGVMMALVALAIHSTVDFNLQLPSNVLLLMVVLAMGWCAWALPSGRK